MALVEAGQNWAILYSEISHKMFNTSCLKLQESLSLLCVTNSCRQVVLLLEMSYGFAVIPLMYLLGRCFNNEVVAYSRLIMV